MPPFFFWGWERHLRQYSGLYLDACLGIRAEAVRSARLGWLGLDADRT